MGQGNSPWHHHVCSKGLRCLCFFRDTQLEVVVSARDQEQETFSFPSWWPLRWPLPALIGVKALGKIAKNSKPPVRLSSVWYKCMPSGLPRETENREGKGRDFSSWIRLLLPALSRDRSPSALISMRMLKMLDLVILRQASFQQ